MKFLTTLLLLFSFACYSQKNNTSGTIKVKKEAIDTSIYTIVEKMPEFPGGNVALKNFISKNIVYPDSAKDFGISGTCYASFIIEKNGRLTDIKIIKGIPNCRQCDIEALKLLFTMPNWQGGSQNGKPVRVRMNLPFKFRLN